MPRSDGFTKFECDRCGAKLYAAPEDPTAKQWGLAKRINASGNEGSQVLCPTCMKDYQNFASKQDSEYVQFLNEKRAE